MCLRSITAIHHPPIEEERTAYKVFFVRGNGVLEYFKGMYDGSSQVICRRWLQAQPYSPSPVDDFPVYSVGFHAYAQRREAKTQLDGFQQTCRRIRLSTARLGFPNSLTKGGVSIFQLELAIQEVRIRKLHTEGIGVYDLPTLVASEMFVLESTTEVIPWPKD